MATIARGNSLELFVGDASSITFTPGSGGSIRFDCSSPRQDGRPTARTIYAAETIAIPAGSTVYAEAVDVDATYIQSPVSGDGIAETMGAYGLRPLNLSAVGNSIVIGSGISGKPPFVLQMPPKSLGKLRLRGNYAVGGHKTSQIISTQLASVPVDTDVLLIMEGTNDASISAPLTTEQHITNINTICNYAISRGMVPLVIETPPNGYTTVDKPAAENYRIAQRIYCEDRGIPFAAPWGFYSNADGSWAAAVTGVDDTHPNVILHDYASKEILSQFVARQPGLLAPYSETDASGVIQSNALLGSGASTPTAWVVGGVTSSQMAQATYPVKGRWSEHTCTNIAAGTNNVYRSLGNPLLYGSAGDTLRIVGWFKFAPSSNMQLACRLQITASPSNSSTWLFDTPVGFGETYFSAETTIPAVTTGNSYLFVQHSNAAAGTYSGDFGFAAIQIWNVTRHRFTTLHAS